MLAVRSTPLISILLFFDNRFARCLFRGRLPTLAFMLRSRVLTGEYRASSLVIYPEINSRRSESTSREFSAT